MKHFTLLALTAISLILPISASEKPSIVPQPNLIQETGGKPITLNAQTQILYKGKRAENVAKLLAEGLRAQTKLPLPVAQFKGSQKKNTIILEISTEENNKNPESYLLISEKSNVTLTAPTSRGLFNATQTLLQLIPLGEKYVPAVKISDAPTYKWRGMMLDVSRYFFTKKYVLRYLDMMAMHKMNVLHWHLIDDSGWRIEIKKYPKLTEIGAWRGKGNKRYGGFYTQDDIREIIAYASARNITIVPEIEIPAHTLSALAAYPHLGCFNKKFEVPTRCFISQELYCAGKESTWTFLEDVFTEVSELFPGKYIHIGGDEAKFSRWNKCPDCQKKMKELNLKNGHELQGWMTTRIEKFLKTKGKRIIGWDEILGAGVSTNAGIMTWHKPKTASDGAKRGNPVVMSLTGHAYFDTPESRLPGEPPAATWIRPISLQKSYEWTPTPQGLTGQAAKNILGASGCLWTDRFMHNAKQLADKPGQGTKASEAYVDYLSLPRMAALSEVCWTSEKVRHQGGFSDFTHRMKALYERYDKLGYQYRIPVPNVQIKKNSDGTYTATAESAIKNGVIRYTLDATTPTTSSKQLDGKVTIQNISDFRAAQFNSDDTRHSLLFQRIDKSNKFAKFGTPIGKWKAGKIGNKKPKEVTFDATGHINANGTYLITFAYTGGRERLDIDGIKVVRNDTDLVDKDIHHGFTGGKSKKNTYTIKVNNYETGATFKIKAMIYGDKGDNSNGIVLIKKK